MQSQIFRTLVSYIIKFLGYIPFDCPDDIVGRLAVY